MCNPPSRPDENTSPISSCTRRKKSHGAESRPTPHATHASMPAQEKDPGQFTPLTCFGRSRSAESATSSRPRAATASTSPLRAASSGRSPEQEIGAGGDDGARPPRRRHSTRGAVPCLCIPSYIIYIHTYIHTYIYHIYIYIYPYITLLRRQRTQGAVLCLCVPQ
jgi:hypothetical protein